MFNYNNHCLCNTIFWSSETNMNEIRRIQMPNCSLCSTEKKPVHMERRKSTNPKDPRDRVVCPICGFGSPIFLVNHRE